MVCGAVFLTPNAKGWNLSCGTMSAATYLHTGYTGTEVCADPNNEVWTVLLTNRVYPTDAPGLSVALCLSLSLCIPCSSLYLYLSLLFSSLSQSSLLLSHRSCFSLYALIDCMY